ncbi:tRNA (guanosine(46)-N7)-methyltransferase TrmB [Clostridia bacterium]|nr:tRNA (guanosine(46)-N7)-methyltransferase TrmB [Clostridia bacterium]
MRIRRRKNAAEILCQKYADFVVEEPNKLKGKWKEKLGYDKLYAEFGSGKGRFVTNKALNQPEVLYVGVEREPEVLIKTAEKAATKLPKNLRLINTDVEFITDAFAKGEVDRLFLNFSDPWPKRRHAKRRLTFCHFLDRYKQILAPGAEIHFKTDNRGLFEFSLNEFSACGWTMKNIRLDYQPEEDSDDIMTEYELKFREMGQPIYRLEAFYPNYEEKV